MSSPQTIFLSLSRGWYTRLFVRSGLLRYLVEETDYRVVILTPAATDDRFVAEVSSPGRVLVEPEYEVTTRSLGDRLYRKGLYALQRSRRLSRLWHRLELPLTRSNHYSALFQRYQPDLVVTASAGLHSPNELPLIREARRRGILTLCVVWSWDNLAMKGPLATRPDKLAVWNTRMFDEACRLHFYDPSDVFITGVPQFDHYFRPETYMSREEFCAPLNLDPSKPIITIATAHHRSVADHRFLIDLLAEAAPHKAYAQDVQLLCRVHPMEDKGFYQAFEGNSHVRMDYPGKNHAALGWLPDDAEDRHLANTLKHTDVLVNIASTVAIEAALLDRPIINVAFSTSEPERFARMVLRNHYGNHYRYVVESGATRIVRSPEELHAAITGYLDNPSLDSAKRRSFAEAMCYRLDGQSARRVKELIVSLAEKGSHQPTSSGSPQTIVPS